MLEPLTRSLLEAFLDENHDSTYGHIRAYVMASVRDATEMQIYLEVMRLAALGAIEDRNRRFIPGDTNRMKYGITEIGRRCLRTRVDPADDPDAAPTIEPVLTDLPTMKKRKRKPTPDNWEW